MSEDPEADTEKLPFEWSGDVRRFDSGSNQVRVDAAGRSDKGKVRDQNEDHYLIFLFGRFLDSLYTNLSDEHVPPSSSEVGYALIVADGLGGHLAGEVASRMAIQSLVHLVTSFPQWILLPDESLTNEVLRRAEERWRAIHTILNERARQSSELQRMATTLTAAWSLGKELYISHVGDSRAYLFRKGQLHRCTRDHTAAQEMVDQGLLLPEEAQRSPLRRILRQVIGGEASTMSPDIQHHRLQHGDCLLLCTDGLTDMVDEGTIAAVLAGGETSAQICQRLVDLALEGGGKDNVTVAVARYDLSKVE
jgi:protein phosphatase